MKNVDLAVKELKKEFKLKGVPGLREIKTIISKMGYTLLTYESSADLLEELELTEDARHYPSISCSTEDKNYTFYRGAVHSNDLLFILCHEIGHIYMNHINYTSGYRDTSDHKEEEANVFATRLLYPQKKKSGKSSILLSFLLLLSIAFGCFTYTKTFWSASAPQEPIIQVAEPTEETKTETASDFIDELIIKVENAAASPEAQVPVQSTQLPAEQPTPHPIIEQEFTTDILNATEQVVVTRTGRKYHKPTCSYLKNKTGTTTYTITEAEENYYAPCSRCFGY